MICMTCVRSLPSGPFEWIVQLPATFAGGSCETVILPAARIRKVKQSRSNLALWFFMESLNRGTLSATCWDYERPTQNRRRLDQFMSVTLVGKYLAFLHHEG